VHASQPRHLTPAQLVTCAVAAAAMLAIVVGAARGIDPVAPLAVALVLAAFAATYERLLQWPVLVGTIVMIILLIPMRRYELPGSLPVQLEPYRLAVLVVGILWVLSLLVQRECRLRRSGFEGPIAAVLGSIVLSVLANHHRVSALKVGDVVTKQTMFWVSFALVFYLVVSVMHRRRDVDTLVTLLTAGGAFLGVNAIIEGRTGFNLFNHLHTVLPILHFDWSQVPLWTGDRGGRARAYGSAQHSIALGAALAMIFPIGIYQARRTGSRLWWLAAGMIALGAFATVSRTAMLMFVFEAIVLGILEPTAMKRTLPYLLPLLVCVHIAIPGTLGAFKEAFFPQGGLVAEQSQGAGTYGSGRVADLGPGLKEWSQSPVFGQGFGTRITERTDPRVNAPILDDQWLGTALETGALGFFALMWLFWRSVRRLGRRAREEQTERSWLAAGIAAGVFGFAMGMITYDAFAFTQVIFLLFILLAIGAVELSHRPEQVAAPARPEFRLARATPAGRPSGAVRTRA
jgi:hypothetical protein